MTLEQRISALATRTANYLRDSITPRLIPTGGSAGQILAKVSANNYDVGWVAESGGGGSDPWTRIKLTSDFTNNTTTFNTMTGLTFTPAAGSDWVMEAFILAQTAGTTSVPRVGLNVVAGQAYGSAAIQSASSATAIVTANGWWTTGLTNVQLAAGTAPVANVPVLTYVWAAGRAGASPTAINLQLAAEIAGTLATAKAGSHMRWMTVP